MLLKKLGRRPKFGVLLFNKYILWTLILVGLSAFTRYLDRIDIRSVIPPGPAIDQIANAGSEYLTLKTVVIGLTHITPISIVYHIVFSAVVVVLGISIFTIAKEKYSRRIAVASALIVASSSYALVGIGSVNFSILSFISLPILVILCSWLHPKHSYFNYFAVGIILAGLITVPYFWLMAIVSILMSKSRLKTLFKHINLRKKALLLLPSAVAAILGGLYSFKKNDYAWLVGRFNDIPNSFGKVFDSIHEFVYRLFIDFDLSTSEKLPLISIGFIVLSIFSMYIYFQGFSSIQQKILPSLAIIAIVATVAGISDLSFVIYSAFGVMVINGLAFLLQQWFTVFPKNPFARSAGVLLIVLLTIIMIFTQLVGYIELTKL